MKHPHLVGADGVESHDVAENALTEESIHVVLAARVHFLQQVHHRPDFH